MAVNSDAWRLKTEVLLFDFMADTPFEDPWRNVPSNSQPHKVDASSEQKGEHDTGTAQQQNLAALSLDSAPADATSAAPSDPHQNVWNLDQADWAKSDVSTQDAPESSPSAAVPQEAMPDRTASSPDQPPPIPDTKQQPATGHQTMIATTRTEPSSSLGSGPDATVAASTSSQVPPAPNSKHRNSPSLPSLSLASIRSAFSGSTPPPPETLTPASGGSAQPVAGPSTASATRSSFNTEGSPSGPPSSSSFKVVSGERQQNDPPFDFKKFQHQMASRAATPLAKDVRGFLKEFKRKRLTLSDQIKAINDFLDDIADKMRTNEIWANATEKEFDNAVEAMEKQIMNSLYTYTFTPAVAHEQPGANILTDDLERDQVLSQRIKLFSWVQETHLDLPEPPSIPARSEIADIKSLPAQSYYMIRAQDELIDVNRYKSPRDKLITLLNTCKLIFMLIRQVSGEATGADTFIPYLILVLLRANPPHLISNLQYIQRFRNPERLQGEAGYYLSSLNGAITFIESMDHSSLSNITQDEFEHQLEQAVSDLQVEEQDAEAARRISAAASGQLSNANNSGTATPVPVEAEDATSVRPSFQAAARDSMDFITRSSDLAQKTMSKPLNAITKILNDLGQDRAQDSNDEAHQHSPDFMRRRGYHPMYYPAQVAPRQEGPSPRRPVPGQREPSDFLPDSATPAAIQAQVDRNAAGQRTATLNTLSSMFPQMDVEVREAVLTSCNNDLAKAVDALLEMGC